MSELFGNNYFFAYVFACIGIFTYSDFKDTQKIIILYLTTFGLAFLKIFSVAISIFFLFIVTFIFLEILSKDEKKLQLTTVIKFKLLDYLFLVIFQYGIIYVLFSIVLTSYTLTDFISRVVNFQFSSTKLILQIASIFIFLVGILRVISERFKTKTFDELMKTMDPSINNVPFDKIDKDIFNMLTDMEDKTYYLRKESYNFLSTPLIRRKIKKYKKKDNKIEIFKRYIKETKHIRGYSTLEMQLMRTLGIVYQNNKLYTRKIYELFYTYIFFNSLNVFYKKNKYTNYWKFKDYLLYIYIRNVNTLIAGKFFNSMVDFIGDDPKDWTKEKCFIAFLGLPHREVNSGNVLKINPEIIEVYDLDRAKILCYIEQIEG